MRWKETWGEFGWRLIPLSDTLLGVLWWLTVLAMIGVVAWIALVTLFRWRARSASFSRLRELARGSDHGLVVRATAATTRGAVYSTGLDGLLPRLDVYYRPQKTTGAEAD